jgi:N-formylglutamate deformylase
MHARRLSVAEARRRIEFTAFVAATLRAMGYAVAINDPYKGVELVCKHGQPGLHRHSLQIEANRRL